MFTVSRSKHNPLLTPCKTHAWESVAVFNASPVIYENKVHLLYRAMSTHEPMLGSGFRMSIIAHATSPDGVNFNERSMFLVPEHAFEKYGLEDPRVTALDDTHFIFYTALSGFPFTADNIKIAVALSKDLKTVDEKHLVTPFNAKAMVLFPEKINNEYVAILSVDTDRKPSHIAIARFKSREQMWSADYWHAWYADLDKHTLKIKRRDSDQVEVGATPLKTEKGWLLIYSHIQDYTSDRPIFGVEALLLDLENPQRILQRTQGAFMVPEEYYEHIGMVPNIVFPSGALLRGNTIELYYGGADTVVAVAYIPLDTLLAAMINEKSLCVRHEPILEPRAGLAWEEGGVFNPAAVEVEGNIYILYRAATKNNASTIGLAISKNGISIDERLDDPVFGPQDHFELLADDKDRGFGTEDPRVVKINGRLYMTYSAYNGKVPRVAVSSIAVSDVLARRFTAWSTHRVISPENFSDKNACIFPERIHGKYVVFHRMEDHICADFVSSLAFDEPLTRCLEVMAPRHGMWDGRKIGISTPPLKTPEGWLLFYHGQSDHRVYRVGIALLDLHDPTIVLARSAYPVFVPKNDCGLNDFGVTVVFPCGLVLRGDTIYLYYGACDRVTGVATFSKSKLLDTLKTVGGN